jgi:hypothetical protein
VTDTVGELNSVDLREEKGIGWAEIESKAMAVQKKDWKNEAWQAYWKAHKLIPEASDAQGENTDQPRNRQ